MNRRGFLAAIGLAGTARVLARVIQTSGNIWPAPHPEETTGTYGYKVTMTNLPGTVPHASQTYSIRRPEFGLDPVWYRLEIDANGRERWVQLSGTSTPPTVVTSAYGTTGHAFAW